MCLVQYPGPGKVWSNYVDTAVSIASAVQVALFYTQTLPVNLALFRLLRIGKLARPIRMITMSSVLASLQLLIKCVAGSVNMLFWSMCLGGMPTKLEFS